MMNYGGFSVPDDLLEAVANAYGLKPVVLRHRVGPRSTVLFLSSGCEAYVGKYYGARDGDQIERVLRLAELAGSAGCPAVAAIRPRDTDRCTVEVSGGRGRFALFPFVRGSEYGPGRIDQLRTAARLLANLHRKKPNVNGPSDSDVLSSGPDLDVCPACSSLLKQIDSRQLMDHEVHLCHGDFRGQNLIFCQNRVAGLLDFDDARIASRLWDLSYAVLFFSAALSASPLLPSERRAFLRTYHQHLPLSPEDLERLPSYLCWAAARGLALWEDLKRSAAPDVHGRLTLWSVRYAPMVEWVLGGTPENLRSMTGDL